MRLEAVADQSHAVELLRRALRGGRVAHAYAFVGPVGAGRTTTALAFAAALLCERPSDGDGCGACRGCTLVARGQHPDLHVVPPTPPESNPRGPRAIRIGAIRELERQAALTPALGARKVFILDDAERMTGDAPQAFLKVLEEPPRATILMLVLPGVRALPATVLSRCQIVRFRPRDDERAIADRREALDVLEAAHTQGVEALFRRTATLDRDRAEGLVDACWLLCRDAMLVRAGAPVSLLVHGERAAELTRAHPEWTPELLLAAIETCREAREGLTFNVAPRLTVEVLMSRLTPWTTSS
jgi:DNA polymerase III delta' subunit